MPGEGAVEAVWLGDGPREDLSRYLAGEPIQARPVTQVERAWRWCKRNRTVAVLLAGVLLTTLGGTAGVTVSLIYALKAKRDLRISST